LNDRTGENAFRAGRRSDRAAYAALVERHYRRVFAVCLGMLANVQDAEDIAQETMLKGLQNLRTLARPERFEPWILRIARNQCLDLMRRQKRAKTLPVERKPTHAAGTHQNHDLERAIRRLPQELRLPLTMFYFERKDVVRIARILGISPSLAYERLRVARKELHELLTQGDCHE